MKCILIIGGTGFMGYHLVWRLLAAGHQITLVNRGQHPDPFGERVTRIAADRRSPSFAQGLGTRDFDAVVDFAAFDANDAQSAVAALRGRVGHYIFISSGAAYMVREGIDRPLAHELSEMDYPGPTTPAPRSAADLRDWHYGIGKRAAEAVLESAYALDRFPATRVRLPIVDGARDPERRLESYIWRILDGSPLLVPDGGTNLTRHVYSGDVVEGLSRILDHPETAGRAYNFSQDETITLRDLLRRLAAILGAPDRTQPIGQTALSAAGLSPTDISPFSNTWSSMLDAGRAKEELAFSPTPLDQYLSAIVSTVLSFPRPDPPKGYQYRSQELSLVHP